MWWFAANIKALNSTSGTSHEFDEGPQGPKLSWDYSNENNRIRESNSSHGYLNSDDHVGNLPGRAKFFLGPLWT